MTDASPVEAQAVLLTGLFGSGKTAVAWEMSYALRERGLPYAVIDLDWLAWCRVDSAEAEHEMMLNNLAPVVANYLAAGMRYFVFARSVRTADDLASLRATLPMPLCVVRLTAPWPEIERRLRDRPGDNEDDLRDAAAHHAADAGAGLEDIAVPNDGPIRAVAEGVVAWLGW